MRPTEPLVLETLDVLLRLKHQSCPRYENFWYFKEVLLPKEYGEQLGENDNVQSSEKEDGVEKAWLDLYMDTFRIEGGCIHSDLCHPDKGWS